LPHLLLKLLGKPLRALAHGVDRTPLTVDGAVGIALAECVFGIAHGAVGIGEIIALALLALPLLPLLPLLTLLALLALLTLLVLAEATLLHLFEQLLELVAQRLLVLPQFAKGVRVAALTLFALLALLALLAALPSLALLAALPALLILAFTEG